MFRILVIGIVASVGIIGIVGIVGILLYQIPNQVGYKPTDTNSDVARNGNNSTGRNNMGNVTINGNNNIVANGDVDNSIKILVVVNRDTHRHYREVPLPEKKAITTRIITTTMPSRVSKECEDGYQKHLAKVAEWNKLFK